MFFPCQVLLNYNQFCDTYRCINGLLPEEMVVQLLTVVDMLGYYIILANFFELYCTIYKNRPLLTCKNG